MSKYPDKAIPQHTILGWFRRTFHMHRETPRPARKGQLILKAK